MIIIVALAQCTKTALLRSIRNREVCHYWVALVQCTSTASSSPCCICAMHFDCFATQRMNHQQVTCITLRLLSALQLSYGMANLLVNVDVASMQCTQTALLNLSMLHLRDALKLPSATPSCAYSAYSNYVATETDLREGKVRSSCIYAMHCNYLAALCCSLTRCAYSAHYYFVAHVASFPMHCNYVATVRRFPRSTYHGSCIYSMHCNYLATGFMAKA